MDKEHGLFKSAQEMILEKCKLTMDWAEVDQVFKKEYETKLKDLKAEYEQFIINNSSIKFGDPLFCPE